MTIDPNNITYVGSPIIKDYESKICYSEPSDPETDRIPAITIAWHERDVWILFEQGVPDTYKAMLQQVIYPNKKTPVTPENMRYHLKVIQTLLHKHVSAGYLLRNPFVNGWTCVAKEDSENV